MKLGGDRELREAFKKALYCECPPRVEGRLYTTEERVCSPNDRGTHCLWCGLEISKEAS